MISPKNPQKQSKTRTLSSQYPNHSLEKISASLQEESKLTDYSVPSSTLGERLDKKTVNTAESQCECHLDQYSHTIHMRLKTAAAPLANHSHYQLVLMVK